MNPNHTAHSSIVNGLFHIGLNNQIPDDLERTFPLDTNDIIPNQKSLPGTVIICLLCFLVIDLHLVSLQECFLIYLCT
jgi:hypothetical protein